MEKALLICFALAVAASAALTPLVARLALFLGVIDRPNERKVNQRPNIPLMGGLAVAASFALVVGIAVYAFQIPVVSQRVLGFAAGALVLLFVGMADDRFDIPARFKLVGQCVAGMIAIFVGFQIDHITDPITARTWTLAAPAMWAATGLWIVGVTNAVNLLDGLDGLASGVGFIIAATLGFICHQMGHPFGVLLGVALSGALLGFLPFNFSPARIFLGDTGSLLIGYSLSLIALEGYQRVDGATEQPVSLLTFIVPILALAVPIIDTALSMLRRLRGRKSIFSADRHHMHHRLMRAAGSQRAAVLSIYFLTASFCMIAVSFTQLSGYTAVLFLLIVLAATARLSRNRGFFELSESGSSTSETNAGTEGSQR